MSGYTEQVREMIEQMSYNQIFVASELKKNRLSAIPEAIFYKALERLVQQEKLVHLTKGLYYRPYIEDHRLILMTEDKIVDYYVADNNGARIGNGLLIEKGIVSGQEERVQLLSNRLVENQKTVGNVSVQKTQMRLDENIIAVIQALEILQNMSDISRINKKRFISYMREFAQNYSEETTAYVLSKRKYKKSTIAFLKEMLDWFGIYNSLEEHLSPLSKYKIPTVEELRLEIPDYVQRRLQEYVAGIGKIYGNHLKEVILYGSFAKGNFDEDNSDIDIMILVDIEEQEINEKGRMLTDLSYDFMEGYELDIKPVAVNRAHFQKWVGVYPFYKNVREEGVYLYGAA